MDGTHVHKSTCLWADQGPGLVSPPSKMTLCFETGYPVDHGSCCFSYPGWQQAFGMVCLPQSTITEIADVHCHSVSPVFYMDAENVVPTC